MVNNDWILDVLADLKSFAAANGLPALAEQIDDTTLVAAAELASDTEKARALAHAKTGQFGPDPGKIGRHQRA